MKLDFFEAGYYYHVFNRGNNRENLFIETKNYYFFLDLLKKHLLPVCEIYCYCLLPNHFHLLIRIKDHEEIPELYQNRIHQPFSNLFNAYTKSINKTYNRSGSLFQEHLHRNRVTNEKYLIQLIAYIHLNPFKHGFTEDFYTYRFSSYQLILSNKKTDLKREKVVEIFDDVANFVFWHDKNKIRYSGILEDIDKLDD